MDKIRVSRSVVGPEEAAAVSRVLLSDGYLGMGAEVRAFEAELATFLQVAPEEVACVSSGTAALQLALESILDPGDEVLVQSLTFVATFQAILAAGAVPVACEILPETITIDLADAARRLTPRTRAIMPVHYASNPGDLDAVYAFARQHHLRVIEDAAHAFGCTYRGKKIGGFGDISCFSFDGIKNITSGEGGAVVSHDRTAMARVRDARLLGVERDTEKRYAGDRSWEFDVKRRGFRLHMSNIFAAIGRVQLRRLPGEFGPKRATLARRYRHRLAGLSAVRFLSSDLEATIPHILPIRVAAAHRDALRARLQAQDIETGLHYKPNHLLTLFGGGRPALPMTVGVFAELLTLPLHPALEMADVDRICEAIQAFFDDCRP